MKKKILIVAMVLCILSLTLVACLNDNDNEELNTGEGLSPIKFTEDMTTQQIIDAINSAKNFTVGEGGVDENNYTIVGETYFVYNYQRYEESYILFMAGNKTYVAFLDLATKNVEGYKKVDFDGYDANLKKAFEREMFYYKKEILEMLQGYSYEIMDGDLRIYDSETNQTQYEVKNVNSSVLVLPKSFADYKTREVTNSPIEYKLNYDNTKYVVTIASGIVSYEIPSSYNGLPVEVIYENVECVSELTLPANLTELKGQNYFFYYPEEEKEIHIIFKGTKDQWKSIEKTSEWRTFTRVSCLDGEYVDE